MANMDVGTPRFYCDYVNYLMSRGVASSEFAVEATDVTGGAGAGKMGTFVTGSAAELFDMKPLNLVTFDTSADNDGHVLVTFDLNTAGFNVDFVAILNHNMSTADAKFRVSATATETEIEAVNHANADHTPTLVEVVNADTISTNICTPATDGHTIVKFTEQAYQFWGIQFEGDGGNVFSATDLSIGCILLGQYYDMPHSPDMTVKRSIAFDAVDVKESLGGQRYGTITNTGRKGSDYSRSPFFNYNTTSDLGVYGGRMSYDLAFSYLNSTDVMPNQYDNPQGSDDAVIEDVWNKTNGRHIPFIFSIDKSREGNDAESEHMFARFGQDSLDMGQVAHKLWNIQMKIDEEF
jgi:hypothetical protein